MATIHFSSGKTREISVRNFENFPIQMQQRGIRLMKDVNEERSLLIPVNSNTMEFIEEIHKPVEKVEVVEEVVEEVDELVAMREELKAATSEVEAKEDKEEKQKRLETELYRRSNCTHKPEDQEIYTSEGKSGKRYFPVCKSCGLKQRYVKADSLSDEQKANAKIWVD